MNGDENSDINDINPDNLKAFEENMALEDDNLLAWECDILERNAYLILFYILDWKIVCWMKFIVTFMLNVNTYIWVDDDIYSM